MWLLAVAGGVTLILAGIVTVIFRHTWAKNAQSAGLARGAGSATVLALSVASVQVLLGAGLTTAGLLQAGSLGSLGMALEGLETMLGGASLGISITTIVLGFGLATLGVIAFRTVWQRRSNWNGNGRTIAIPPQDRVLIVMGTLGVAFGLICITVGSLILAAD